MPALTGGGAGASAAGAGFRTRYKPAPTTATARAVVAVIAAFLMPSTFLGAEGIVSSVYYRQEILLASPAIPSTAYFAPTKCPAPTWPACLLAIAVPSRLVPSHDWRWRRFVQRPPFGGRSRSWLLTTPCAPFCRSPTWTPTAPARSRSPAARTWRCRHRSAL